MNPEILCKYLDNTATDAEKQQVVDWLNADEAHRKELNELDKVFCAATLYEPAAATQRPLAPVSRLRRIVRYATEAAAVLLLGLVATFVLTNLKIEEWSQKTTAIEVPAGHYISMQLADGTTVWLNSATRLEYPLVFAGGERRVKVSGEALFDVKHDSEHPFIVETYACDVEVLGTRFDVMADEAEKQFSTSLLRGRVKVTNRLVSGESCVLNPNESVHLVGGHLSRDVIETPDEFLWIEGVISVAGMNFTDLMTKFERCFGVKIRIDRNDLPSTDYNYGKIRISDGIDSALRLLQQTSHFIYERDEENGVIIIK